MRDSFNINIDSVGDCGNKQWVCKVTYDRLIDELACNDKFIRGIAVPVSSYRSDLKNDSMVDSPGGKVRKDKNWQILVSPHSSKIIIIDVLQ